MQDVADKIGETFLNQKAYILVPIYPKDLLMYQPVLSKFGGEIDQQQDLMFNYAQLSGRFDYDSNYINMNSCIMNLKTSILQLTDRIYVDKPIKKQKEVPMQRQRDLSQTFVDNKIINLKTFKQKPKADAKKEEDNQMRQTVSNI